MKSTEIERWRGEMDATVKNTQAEVSNVRSDLNKFTAHVTTEMGDLKVKVGTAAVKIGFITSGAVILTGLIVSILTAILSAKFGIK